MSKENQPTRDGAAPAPASPSDSLFHPIELPRGDGPAHFAIALPARRLAALPGLPTAALPQNGRIASGRGLTADAARRSACGEAAELASCCAWGDERLASATAAEIEPDALSPAALNGFAPGQLRARRAWNRRHGFDWRPPPFDLRRPIDWIAVDDAFGGPSAFAPADFVLIGRREAGDEDAAAVADSNGCAAGPDPDAARLAALLELVERDATGRWWYGRRPRQAIDPAGIEGAGELTRWLAGRGRRSRLFEITTDLGIPVFAAASAEPDGRDVALGFAARLGADAAAISALTEMLQMEVSLAAARLLGDRAGTWSTWRAAVTMRTLPLDAADAPARGRLTRPSHRSPSGPDLSAALEACARSGIDLWFADMTRPAIGVPVFRALSTALCHYKPRFARKRLLAKDARDRSPGASVPGQPWLNV